MNEKTESLRKNKRESGGSLALGQRMKEICEKVWDGDVRQMAEDLDLSHPVLYRVFSRKQPPPGVLIERLAVHPKVNRDWLFTGEGLFRRGDWKAPIATAVLPGDPRKYESLLSPRTFPISSDLAQPTRYFVEVQANDHVLRSETLKLDVGDLLLMETDRDSLPQCEDLDGCLGGVSVQAKEGVQFQLGQLTFSWEEPGTDAAYLAVDTFHTNADIIQEFGVQMNPDGTLHPFRRTRKRIQYRESERLLPVESSEGYPALTRIAPEAIVCVCLLLVRRVFRRDS